MEEVCNKDWRCDPTLPLLNCFLGMEGGIEVEAEESVAVETGGKDVSRMEKSLDRSLLIKRLELERTLYIGLRMIVLCTALFSSLIFALHFQTNKEAQFALQQSYEETLDLPAAAEVVTANELRNQLREISSRIRTFQVLSSAFFVEKQGQLKILSGIRLFAAPQTIEVADLMPRIDSESFTFMAWVQRDSAESSGYIVRKPLGTSGKSKSLSCYGWYIGSTPRLDFGAHDVGLPDQSANEESVKAGGQWEVDDSFHLEMIVVDPTSIRFYRDAQLRSNVPLRRSVTDCSGSRFLVGDKGLQLAEITFYARSLSQTEIEEIFFAGFTFEAIAAGKLPHQPSETPFDRMLGAQDQAVSTLLSSQNETMEQAAVGRVLTQALIQQLQAAEQPDLAVISVPADAGCARDWPPCRTIRGVNETETLDEVTGKRYFNLIPPKARNGAGPQDRMFLGGSKRSDMMQFDVGSFPSWKGQAATFSVWARPDTLDYFLSKAPNPDQNEMCWSLYVSETYGIGTWGAAMGEDGWMYPNNNMRWGGSIEAAGTAEAPIRNVGKMLRHVAWVFDNTTNSLRAYMDGALVQDQPFLEPDAVNRLDCDVTNTTYIGFAHRPPGAMPTLGDYQDFRMYVGSALTSEEVAALALGQGSKAERECSLSAEGQDSNYKDMNGNNCAWYQEAMSETEAVCTAPSVRAECAVACGTQEPCYEPTRGSAPTHQIWEKIMRIQPHVSGLGSFCVREDVDVATACVAAYMQRDPNWSDNFLHWGEGGIQEWDVTNCLVLNAMIDPSCSFSVPGDWTKTFDAEAQASGEWTVSFWYKISKDANDINTEFDTWMTFYSSVSPPIPLFRILKYYNTLGFQVWGRPDCDSWEENVGINTEFDAGKWVHLAVTFGAPRGTEGLRHLQIVKDSEYAVDLLNREWCPPSAGEFIQAISILPFSHEVLISPITVTAHAHSVKDLQSQYYQLQPLYRWRRGPAKPESTRHSGKVQYTKFDFDAAGALLAPPILLQRRLESAECAASSGSQFKHKVWRDAVEGMTCGPPYTCPEEVLNSSSALLRCTGTDNSLRFLGRAPLNVNGQETFGEFLPSIADASILVREGQLFQTSEFIDTQTTFISLPVVLLAPDSGVLTLISIEASLGSRVHVDYKFRQFQALEGDDLAWAQRQVALTYVLVALGVLELSWEGMKVVRQRHREKVKYIILDMMVLIVMPVVYLATRQAQFEASAEVTAQVVGDGLGSVPWASTELNLDDKMDAFLLGLEQLQSLVDREQRMRVLGFAAAVLLLLRVILATKAHPRTAILVNTIHNAADDLCPLPPHGHFILLFLVLYLGFAAVAHVSFGNATYEFHSIAITFETLFDMMLGSLPKHSAARSQSWTADPLMIIFVSLFNFLVFFVLLNFIIAIIVESYLATKERLHEEVTEQEILTDVLASIRALIKRAWFRWPSHLDVLAALGEVEDETVNEEALVALLPSAERTALMAFVSHYKEFGFLDPKGKTTDDDTPLAGAALAQEIARQVEERLIRVLSLSGNVSAHTQPHHAMAQSDHPSDRTAPKTTPAAWTEKTGGHGVESGAVTVEADLYFQLPNAAQHGAA